MNETPNPITREETYLSTIAAGSGTVPTPITREELFLAKAAGADVETPTPITRKEMFLDAIQGGGGSSFQTTHLTFHYDPAIDQEGASEPWFGTFQNLQRYAFEALSGKACMYITLDAFDDVLENPPKISLFNIVHAEQDKLPFMEVPDYSDGRYLSYAAYDADNWKAWIASGLIGGRPQSVYDFDNQALYLQFQSCIYPYSTFTSGIIANNDSLPQDFVVDESFTPISGSVSQEIKDAYGFGITISAEQNTAEPIGLNIVNMDYSNHSNTEYAFYEPPAFTLHVIRLSDYDEVTIETLLNPEILWDGVSP